MRVDLLTREYPPHVYGGAGVHVLELAKVLRGLVGAVLAAPTGRVGALRRLPAPGAPRPGGSPTRVGGATVAARRDELLATAASLPGAWAGHKPEWDIPVASVGPRLFLLLIPHTDGRLLANAKLDPEDVVAVRTALQEAGIDYDSAEVQFVASTEVELDLEGALKVNKLIDVLEDSDDVQNIYTNMSLSDEVRAQLEEQE